MVMDKSIENIWKDGFAKEHLVIPRVKVLYDKKSISVVEEVIYRFKREVFILLPAALFIFLFNLLLDNNNSAFWGVISAIPCFIWYFIGKKQINSVTDIKYNINSYQYLLSIRQKLLAIMQFNKKLIISSVPIMILPMLIYTYYNQKGKSIGEIIGVEGFDFPTITIFLLLPIFTLIAMAFANLLFKKQVADKMKDINTLIKDMEELRA